ncbi:class I adenylate-forming enzyme family protein [Geomonas agri]|uniref:class I adenylate-forming enzyme family protein n=1 Tax=Geomonas agri TaxID=2873702 RepID=UPI001CD63342|nr:class I adenylate-forming enzyme family protein [Geomonas agri]
MLIHQFLERSAARLPDKVALILGERRVSYAQLEQSANSLANWLAHCGTTAGGRVLLLVENSEEYVISYYAILKAGLVAVPMSPETRSDTLRRIMERTTPQVVIASARGAKALGEAPPCPLAAVLLTAPSFQRLQLPVAAVPFEELLRSGASPPPLSLAPGSLASIIFTSGSSGPPKGVMLSHANVVANTCSIVAFLGLTEADRQMVVLPFFYVMGKSLLNTHIAVGASLVINNTFAYPATVLTQMEEEEVTGFSGVPSTYAYLLHRSPLKAYRDRLPALRYCSQAGGHMARQVKEELLRALPPHTKLYVMYGATEASARLSYVEPERLREKIDSIGIPIPGVTMKVVDASGRELSEGETGELVAAGDNIMTGYWRDPEGTRRVLGEHGYRTGDMGYRDRDGYFYLVGRGDRQLKVGGHRIAPQEVEDALMATGLLVEAAVFGVEDPLAGHRLVAVGVPINGGTTGKEVLGRCQKWLPKFKMPGELRLVRVLPKLENGKVAFARLREEGAG